MATKEDLYRERSPLWGISAGAALAGGVGYSIYKGRADLLSALKMGSTDVASQVSKIAAEYPRISSNINVLGSTDELRLGLLQLDKEFNPVIKSDISHGLYQSIMATGRVTHEDAYRAFRSVSEQETIGGLYTEAEKQLSRYSGDRNTFNQMLERLSGLKDSKSAVEALTDLERSRGGFNLLRRSTGLDSFR
jgi:hypothetical protein